MPEDQRAELIDGKLCMMATPSRTHQSSFSDKVKSGIYDDFEIDFSEINIEKMATAIPLALDSG